MISVNLNKNIEQLLIPEIPLKEPVLLGKYSFLNCLPVNLPMEDIPETIIKSTYGTPAVINHLLNEKKLVAGPISSYEYLKNRSEFELLDGFSISSKYNVASVILFSNKAIQDLGSAKIAVANSSSTSIRLLHIIIKSKTGLMPELIVHCYEKPLLELLKEFDAVLYIGDPALYSYLEYKNNEKILTYDLAKEWSKITSKPMVFGVWVAVKSWAQNNDYAFNYLKNSLIYSKNLGLGPMFNKVIKRANEISNLPETILKNYYTKNLSYDFSCDEISSLELFHCHLKENKLL